MDKQMSLSGLSDELSQVRTKKKEFLGQIERIVPWGEWIELIRPHYYKGESPTIWNGCCGFIWFKTCMICQTWQQWQK